MVWTQVEASECALCVVQTASRNGCRMFVDVVVTLPGCSIQRLPPLHDYTILFAEKRDETKTI